MITLKWSLRNHFQSHTCLNHRVLKWFRTRFIIAIQNDSAKTEIFDETNKNWNGARCGTFPFTTRRSLLTIPAVSINQNWRRVCVFLYQEAAIESYNRSCPFSFLFLQHFNSMLSTNTSTFDTSRTPIPVNIMSWIFTLLFLFARGILRIHPYSGNFCSKGSSSSSFPISTILQLVRCHHQMLQHVDSGLSLDLQAHCSAILVSRLLSGCSPLLVSVDFISRFR